MSPLSPPTLVRSAFSAQSYFSDDTVAAIITGSGGAVSLIRLSGPKSFEILGNLIQKNPERLEARKLYRTHLYDQNTLALDDALVVRFKNPESFTGEDIVELHLHGGGFVAGRVMEVLLGLGARQALPGEFSFRAVRHGKSTLGQAQAIADLIASSNQNAVSLALEKMSGAQNQMLTELAEKMRALATFSEIGIDFSDQDVEEVSLKNLKLKIPQVLEQLLKLKNSYDRGSRVQDGVKVALIGAPNAGKSSFFNALLGEDRSIVSAIAGTTRDIVRERITLSGRSSSVTLKLEDTAGIRNSENEIEQMGIERSLAAARNADLILAIVDPTADVSDFEMIWAQLKTSLGEALLQKTLGILTKRDLFKNTSLPLYDQLRKTGIPTWLETSAETGHGISEASEMILDFCAKWTHRSAGEVLLTRLDHLRAVSGAIEHLSRAQETTEIDLFASDTRQALQALAPLIGDTLPDDILGKIFSEFCIGK